MNRTIKIASLIAAATLAAGPVRAADQGAGMPGEWLTQYASARTLGLGNAYVATANDPFGILWNPAGLSGMEQNELHFETARLFDDTAIHGLGFAVPGSWLPSFGLTILTLRSGEFEKTNELNDALGTFSEGETAYLFTVSRAFSPRLAVGANLKVIQQTVEEFSAGGFGADLGATYEVIPGLKIGASIANLGGPNLKLRDTEEPWPTAIRGGAALQVLGGRGLIALQVDQSDGLGARFHGGGEYKIQNAFALRAGFDQTRATGGLSYQFAPQYTIDYGVADHPLGMTHRLGMSWKFGGFFASSSADPQVFSPTGEHAVTRISLNSRTKSEPESWTVEILSKSDEVVRRFGGKGQPPSHLQWDGKDETGLPLPDGVYRFNLVVRDQSARVLESHTRTIEISTTGPQGTVPVVETP
jgi:hypothetical protein